MKTSIEAPLSEHLDALRRLLIRSLLVITTGFALTFCFYQQIFSVITWPLQSTLSDTTQTGLTRSEVKIHRIQNTSSADILYSLPSSAHSQKILIPAGSYIDAEVPTPLGRLAIFSPVEGITTALKISFWAALTLTAPLWLYFFLDFAAPALHGEEKRLLFPFICLSVAFLIAGLTFAHFVTLPLSNAFLWAFNADLGNNLWSLANYLDFSLFLLLANALAFEIALILFFLVHLEVITPAYMSEHRRHAVVLALILAALLTPPDIPSQLMLATPLLVLYELAIFYGRIKQKKESKADSF